ncbi:hypothetical protein NX88_07450 [Neisseria meningitidis]|nr:hypothetical protein NX88_07450 [Neisseria meningitidis]
MGMTGCRFVGMTWCRFPYGWIRRSRESGNPEPETTKIYRENRNSKTTETERTGFPPARE